MKRAMESKRMHIRSRFESNESNHVAARSAHRTSSCVKCVRMFNVLRAVAEKVSSLFFRIEFVLITATEQSRAEPHRHPRLTISMATPTLYVLAADREYDKIVQRVATHPQDLAWRDARGLTCLHPLCVAPRWEKNALDAMRAIVKRRPGLLAVSNETGFTPMHTIINCGNLDESSALCRTLVLFLIRSCPAAVSAPLQLNGLHGTTPFHFACQLGVHIDILRAMLQMNPSLAKVPCQITHKRALPLQLLWSRYAEPVDSLLPGSTLDKMDLVLRTAHNGKVVPSRPGRAVSSHEMLCAACGVECPSDYFQKIFESHSGASLTQRDEHGNIPLDYATRNTVDSKDYSAAVIRALLLRNRACASIRSLHTHRLPLQSALLEGHLTWSEGVQELVYAHPSALEEIDMQSGLYPFMSSAVHAHESDCHLSTTVELLLASPGLVQMGVSR